MQVDKNAILKARPARDRIGTDRPYFWLHEKEPSVEGISRSVNTLFLSNSECSFKCLMCDLWKKTTKEPTPAGSIPKQIRFGLNQLPQAPVLKLYNNGNFFDRRAIPEHDYPEIIELVSPFDHLIVENHPNLCNDRVTEFRESLKCQLEVAIGLETVHPEILPRLGKQITTDDFERAVRFLSRHNIQTRAFVLFHPPFLTGKSENIYWTLESLRFAFRCGVDVCSVIPVRTGNGIMEQLEKSGDYVPPTLESFETVISEAQSEFKGRVFADLWGLEKFSTCDLCLESRKSRLNKMNLSQMVIDPVECQCSGKV